MGQTEQRVTTVAQLRKAIKRIDEHARVVEYGRGGVFGYGTAKDRFDITIGWDLRAKRTIGRDTIVGVGATRADAVSDAYAKFVAATKKS
jgi:hypothetical protein